MSIFHSTENIPSSEARISPAAFRALTTQVWVAGSRVRVIGAVVSRTI
jgi:hypothetical protein